MIWFFGPFPGPLSSALAKPKRHNPDILSFGGIQSPRKERASDQAIPSRYNELRSLHLDFDLAIIKSVGQMLFRNSTSQEKEMNHEGATTTAQPVPGPRAAGRPRAAQPGRDAGPRRRPVREQHHRQPGGPDRDALSRQPGRARHRCQPDAAEQRGSALATGPLEQRRGPRHRRGRQQQRRQPLDPGGPARRLQGVGRQVRPRLQRLDVVRADGTLYVSTIAFNLDPNYPDPFNTNGSAVYVSKSTDGGYTWSARRRSSTTRTRTWPPTATRSWSSTTRTR